MSNFFTRIKLLLLICLPCINHNIFAQCPVSNFTISSPVCSGSTLQILNNSTGANSYKWDFSPGFFNHPAVKSADTLLNLSFPGDITTMMENDTVIGFIPGLADGKLHRIIYGNGPGQPATLVEDLGNLGVFYQPSDITFYQENSTWYGFVVDYGSNYLYRIRFGNSLRNTPDSITTILNNTASQFNGPWSIKIVADSVGDKFAMVCNHANASISILSFGNSILNIPSVAAPITVPGVSNVPDGVIAKSCGKWFAFLACHASGKVIRADFGNTLTNTPTFTTIITDGAPSDIILVDDGSHWKLLYTDINSWQIKKYDLGLFLTNNFPVSIGTDYFSGQTPKGISYIRKDTVTFVYVLYQSNNVQTLAYTNSVNINKSISTSAVPNDIVFDDPGNYAVTLLIKDAGGNVSSYTDTITVTPAPHTHFNVTQKCFGDTTSFIDSSYLTVGTVTDWQWNFGDGGSDSIRNASHHYSVTGTYNVRLVATSSFGCSDTLNDSINITPKPTVSFSSPSSACSQTGLQFNDNSTVAAGTLSAWMWKFGNGDTSSSQNPFYYYPAGGTFNVNLRVTTSDGCSDTSNLILPINDRPSVNFEVDNTCVGQNVLFTDKTVLNNSNVDTYAWDFGDGNSDSVASPSHQYSGGVNVYPVSLTVTALNGCSDTAQQTVKINNVPTVVFVYAPAAACQNNDVQFTDLSSVAGDTIAKWLWDFGNNEFDSVANPVHRFSNPGANTVSLIAYSPSKCPGTVYQEIINVRESPVASYSYSTTCIGNSTHFTNNSTPATGSTIDSILWSFNGAGTSSIFNPDFTFTTEGSFPVTLTVMSPEGCSDSQTIPVLVHSRPNAAFSHSNPCTGNAVLFSNGSTCDSLSTITQYDWNFGDILSGANNTSALPNPSHAYTSTQTFNASLITITNFGCKDTAITTFIVNPSPTAQFTYSPTCVGSMMSFFNPGTPLDSAYIWDFGDAQNNQLREPAHYYASDGVYTVRLNVITNAGCSTIATRQVTVSPIPTADFATTPACVNSDYLLHDNSWITSGSIAFWKWDVSGLPAPDSIEEPNYIFPDTGSYSITLQVTSDAGCKKQITKSIDVHGLPVSSFTFDPQFGNPPLEVQTTDLSTGGAYYLWDFGDGNIVNMQEPSTVFNDTGLFVITQYVTSLYGCTDSSSQNIYVITPVLDVAITGDSSYFEGNYFHIVARLENHGTRDLNNIQMEANLEDGNTIREIMTEKIPTGPLGRTTYQFHAAFLTNGIHDFQYYCIRALLPQGDHDKVPSNNERCVNTSGELIFSDPFPNPFTRNLNFKFMLPKAEDLKIELFDMAGKIVQTIFDGKAGKNLFEINADLSALDDGVYVARIIYREEVIVRSVVKNNHVE